MVQLSFDRPPVVGLLALARKRGRVLKSGESIPRIEAVASKLDANAEAYARICGFPAVGPLPITYPNLLAANLQKAVLTHPQFPLRLFGVVHTRQRIEQFRALHPNEAFSGRCSVEGFRPVRRGGEFDLHTSIFAGGEEVWRGVTTILSRELPGHEERRLPVQPVQFPNTRSCAWKIREDQGRRYAKVSGDNNPIHQFALTARPFGFKRAIVHGWWSLARVMAEMDADVGGACMVECAFHAPVSLPSTVFFRAGPYAQGHAFELRSPPGKHEKVLLSGTVGPRPAE